MRPDQGAQLWTSQAQVVLNASHLKRQVCARCRRPQNACICQWIAPVAHEVQVLILQHPLELDNAKGSARLLHLSLPRSQMVTGEIFDKKALACPARQDILLYPGTPLDLAQGHLLSQPTCLNPLAPHMRIADGALLPDPTRLRLIVLDGTWRKSRKMLHLNPWLGQLPRLSLQGLPVSNYRIRKAHGPHQLSTLEASCAALMRLEARPEKFWPMLAGFDGFVAQQLGYRERRAETIKLQSLLCL